MTTCRSCGAGPLHPLLDLGLQPLANNLLPSLDRVAEEPKFPLRVNMCLACGLGQIDTIVPPHTLFSDYVYFSSYSDTMLAHAEGLAAATVERHGLGPNDLVVEIASNDGYLLKNYQARGIQVLGVEPAANVAAVAEAKHGIRSVVDFFGAELADRLVAEGVKASIIHGLNVLAHVPEVNGFVEGIARLLKEDGAAVFEFPYLLDMIEHLEFDTIYHEHVFYFSLTSVVALFARHGLTIVDCQKQAIHGGTLRITAKHQAAPPSPEMAAILAAEAGILDAGFYDDFSRRVHANTSDLKARLLALKAEGKSIAAYGASAKGATYLNFAGLGREVIDFVADRSQAKQGKLTPGTHIPIVAAEELLARQPDYVLLLTWNFAEEILAQQDAYRQAGGKFIVPVPEFQIR